MTTTPLISIIIVQYNNSQDTIRCLENLKELNYPNYNVIVVDNASIIKDLNAIRFFIESSQDSRITIIQSRKNLGYAGGNNLGIKKALKKKVGYILILNPDTIVKPDILNEMLEAGKSNPKTGIIGTTIDEGSSTINAGVISWFKSTLQHIKHESGNILDENLYIPGAAMLIKKDVFDKIGLLDERYFLYFEDADFAMRAKKVGFKLATTKQGSIRHSVSSSSSQLGSPTLLYYHFRNAHLFNWKNGPLWVKFCLPFWSIFIMLKQIVKLAFMPDKRRISRAILTGVVDFYRGKFGYIADLF